MIAVECAVAYLCLPTVGDTAAMAGAVGKAARGKGPGQETAADAEAVPADVEVDLGEFCVTALQPTANLTLRIDFHLYGSVGADTEKEFKHLLEDNKHRFREQVLVTIRSADITDLTDPNLGLVKRLILEKAHKTLGKPLCARSLSATIPLSNNKGNSICRNGPQGAMHKLYLSPFPFPLSNNKTP